MNMYVEPAPSNRSRCVMCLDLIPKGEIRLAQHFKAPFPKTQYRCNKCGKKFVKIMVQDNKELLALLGAK